MKGWIIMKDLEFGERYTWDDVKEAYPGMWVRMSECNLTTGSGIVDGILIGVYDDESIDVEIEMLKKKSKDKLRRTTFDMNVGVIDCLNAEMEVRDEP